MHPFNNHCEIIVIFLLLCFFVFSNMHILICADEQSVSVGRQSRSIASWGRCAFFFHLSSHGYKYLIKPSLKRGLHLPLITNLLFSLLTTLLTWFCFQIFNAKVRDFDAVVSDQAAHGKCIVTAVRDIKAASEVFVTYGPLSNSRLLLRYGYVEEQNPFDQVEVCVHASKYTQHNLTGMK